MPGFPGIFPFIRISKADFTVAHQNETVGIPVKMGLGEMLLGLRNVAVPYFRWFVDMAVTIEHRKILCSALGGVCHTVLLWIATLSTVNFCSRRKFYYRNDWESRW